MEVHALWVAGSESLSNVSVVDSLSVSELDDSKSETQHGSEGKAALNAKNVRVHVIWTSLGSIISVGKESSENSTGGGWCSSNNIVCLLEIHDVDVEHLRVVLDGLNSLDLCLHVLI